MLFGTVSLSVLGWEFFSSSECTPGEALTVRDRRHVAPGAESVTSTNTVEPATDVVVYLAQFGHHSSYGRQTDGHTAITGASKLNRSLSLLYSNYLNAHPCDVIIFYTADDALDPSLKEGLKRNRPRLSFRKLTGEWWSLPYGLRAEDRTKWRAPAFGIGYRHMIRW